MLKKLEFRETYPYGFDALNGCESAPVAISRMEAAIRLRKARRLGQVRRDGTHQYVLSGSNTVILQPAPPGAR